MLPNDREACWRLSPEAWLYVEADPQRAGSARNTLFVADLDAFLAAARGRGIEPGPVELVAGSIRQSVVVDPDGNRLKVAGRPG